MMRDRYWNDDCGPDKDGRMEKKLAKDSVSAALRNPEGKDRQRSTFRNPLNRRFLPET